MPSPVDLPDPGIEAGSPALQVDSLPTELSEKWKKKKKKETEEIALIVYVVKSVIVVSSQWFPTPVAY